MACLFPGSSFLLHKICSHYDLVRVIVLRDLRKWVHPEPTDEGSSSSYHCKNKFDTPCVLCDDTDGYEVY